MSKITAEPFIDRIDDTKEVARFISIFFEQTKRIVNNGFTFQDNLDGKVTSITFSGATTNQALAHGLGRVPVGYQVIRRSANIAIYDGTSPFTASSIFLASSGAGSVTLLVF